MDNGQPQTNRPNLLKYGAIIAALIIVLALAFFAWHSKNSTHRNGNDSSQSAEVWNTYTNKKYGFEFKYPSSWGSPVFSELGGGSSKDLSIKFVKQNPDNSKSIVLKMTSTTVSSSCPKTDNSCASIGEVTKNYINQRISSTPGAFTLHDNNSFTIVKTNPKAKLQSGMDLFQVVNLQSLGIDAAHIQYYILGTGVSCPNNKLSSDPGCITQEIYNNSKELLNSIKAD